APAFFEKELLPGEEILLGVFIARDFRLELFGIVRRDPGADFLAEGLVFGRVLKVHERLRGAMRRNVKAPVRRLTSTGVRGLTLGTSRADNFNPRFESADEPSLAAHRRLVATSPAGGCSWAGARVRRGREAPRRARRNWRSGRDSLCAIRNSRRPGSFH